METVIKSITDHWVEVAVSIVSAFIVYGLVWVFKIFRAAISEYNQDSVKVSSLKAQLLESLTSQQSIGERRALISATQLRLESLRDLRHTIFFGFLIGFTCSVILSVGGILVMFNGFKVGLLVSGLGTVLWCYSLYLMRKHDKISADIAVVSERLAEAALSGYEIAKNGRKQARSK